MGSSFSYTPLPCPPPLQGGGRWLMGQVSCPHSSLPDSLNLKAAWKCGMVISDHPNAMQEHLKSPQHKDYLANGHQFDACAQWCMDWWVGASLAELPKPTAWGLRVGPCYASCQKVPPPPPANSEQT